MNREHWSKMLPIITAFVEGRTVQFKTSSAKDTDPWVTLKADDTAGFFRDCHYRIKPEPKLRPWNPEEVPVGSVVRSKRSKADRWQITGVNAAGIALSCDSARNPFSEMLSDWEMLDGSPCGVEVSE